MKIRVGIPETTGSFPLALRRIGAPAMISAGALWTGAAFKLTGRYCRFLDKALDSGGFVCGGKFPWSLPQYVRLAWQDIWAWWSQPDLPCEQALAPDRAAVLDRIRRSAQMYRDCAAEAARQRGRGMSAALSDPVPVLQGRDSDDYKISADLLSPLPEFIGVGSMCTREVRDAVEITEALDKFLPPHVTLHLYGVKGPALRYLRQISRVVSVDSMAWDFRARKARGTGASKTTDRVAEMLRWYAAQRAMLGETTP